MTQQVEQLINLLKQNEIKLWVEGEQLKFTAKLGVFTDELKQKVAKVKPNMVNFLSKLTINVRQTWCKSRRCKSATSPSMGIVSLGKGVYREVESEGS